jgi:hypothetical protein
VTLEKQPALFSKFVQTRSAGLHRGAASGACPIVVPDA